MLESIRAFSESQKSKYQDGAEISKEINHGAKNCALFTLSNTTGSCYKGDH